MSDPDAPPLDEERIIEVLDRHKIDYVLVGGLGARLHGATRLTNDFDLCPSFDRENLTRLAAALNELGARLRGIPDDIPVPPVSLQGILQMELAPEPQPEARATSLAPTVGVSLPARRLGPQSGVRLLTAGVGLEEVAMEAQVGARIIVEGNKVGQGRREGEVVEVMATPEPVHYRVRWTDGHESIFFPSSDARVETVTRSS